jgi:hypothetical protein
MSESRRSASGHKRIQARTQGNHCIVWFSGTRASAFLRDMPSRQRRERLRTGENERIWIGNTGNGGQVTMQLETDPIRKAIVIESITA